MRITQQVTQRRKTRVDDEEDVEDEEDAEDSIENLDVFKNDSDVESGELSVDTDVDSVPSQAASKEGSDSTEPQASDNEGSDSGAEPTDIAPPPKKTRSTLKPLWFTHFFYIRENIPHHHQDVKIHLYDAWATPAAMGRANRSKTFTPKHHDETVDNPVRSLLLCRAWMVWRCRNTPWAFASRGRARQFEADATSLEDDIRALQSPDRLLGNAKANDKLQSYVPDICQRLQA